MADKPELESSTILKSVVDKGRRLVRLIKICRFLEDIKGRRIILLILLVHHCLRESEIELDRATLTPVC
jgi:hypothetical protein